MKIGIVGLGYVGLPLAAAFSKHFEVYGFDIHPQRVQDIQTGIDRTNELDAEQLHDLLQRGFQVSQESDILADCTVFIVTVPTPVDKQNQPDLGPLRSASQTVAQYLKPGDLVIYESTTFPGCTEEVCVPLLEAGSQLLLNRDFFVGYSPERINPGDKINTLETVVKITSGSNAEAALKVDLLYKTIIKAGTHLAESIKVAEAAKAIENAQRDVNISFVNELSLIFDKMGIDTYDVLNAAQTKWNFLPFKPGLVGGHCIGVDPHYLAFKAQQLGHEPQVIRSGRTVNESMAEFV
ncbi:MAG: nucleotide sugar dehydrogenase, partial [Bacteroidia bacterium]